MKGPPRIVRPSAIGAGPRKPLAQMAMLAPEGRSAGRGSTGRLVGRVRGGKGAWAQCVAKPMGVTPDHPAKGFGERGDYEAAPAARDLEGALLGPRPPIAPLPHSRMVFPFPSHSHLDSARTVQTPLTILERRPCLGRPLALLLLNRETPLPRARARSLFGSAAKRSSCGARLALPPAAPLLHRRFYSAALLASPHHHCNDGWAAPHPLPPDLTRARPALAPLHPSPCSSPARLPGRTPGARLHQYSRRPSRPSVARLV